MPTLRMRFYILPPVQVICNITGGSSTAPSPPPPTVRRGSSRQNSVSAATTVPTTWARLGNRADRDFSTFPAIPVTHPAYTKLDLLLRYTRVKVGWKKCCKKANSTRFSTSAPTVRTPPMANPFSCFSEKGKMADRMCDGLLSPTFIALSNLEKLLELRFEHHAY